MRRAGRRCRTPGRCCCSRPVRATRLDRQLSAALAPWRKPLARHDPAKVLDLAVALALGGDCLADVALLRAGPQLFGPVASDPTVSRTVDTLAADERALTAIATAWATARARAWALAGTGAADADVDSRRPLVVDLGGDQQGHAAGAGAQRRCPPPLREVRLRARGGAAGRVSAGGPLRRRRPRGLRPRGSGPIADPQPTHGLSAKARPSAFSHRAVRGTRTRVWGGRGRHGRRSRKIRSCVGLPRPLHAGESAASSRDVSHRRT